MYIKMVIWSLWLVITINVNHNGLSLTLVMNHHLPYWSSGPGPGHLAGLFRLMLRLFIDSLIHWSIRSFYSFLPSFIHSFTDSFNQSFIQSLIHSWVHAFMRSCICCQFVGATILDLWFCFTFNSFVRAWKKKSKSYQPLLSELTPQRHPELPAKPL